MMIAEKKTIKRKTAWLAWKNEFQIRDKTFIKRQNSLNQDLFCDEIKKRFLLGVYGVEEVL